jgi:hypothetical protein
MNKNESFEVVLSNAEIIEELRRLMEPIKDRVHSTLLLDMLLYEVMTSRPQRK